MPAKVLGPASAAATNVGDGSIEQTYQKLTQHEHILQRPDTYVGSIEAVTSDMWIMDVDSGRMTHRPVTYVPGLYKIFDEIVVNAADNKQRDPNMTELKITIDKENNRLSVYNNGNGIPVAMHKEHNIYVPELIFGARRRSTRVATAASLSSAPSLTHAFAPRHSSSHRSPARWLQLQR